MTPECRDRIANELRQAIADVCLKTLNDYATNVWTPCEMDGIVCISVQSLPSQQQPPAVDFQRLSALHQQNIIIKLHEVKEFFTRVQAPSDRPFKLLTSTTVSLSDYNNNENNQPMSSVESECNFRPSKADDDEQLPSNNDCEMWTGSFLDMNKASGSPEETKQIGENVGFSHSRDNATLYDRTLSDSKMSDCGDASSMQLVATTGHRELYLKEFQRHSSILRHSQLHDNSTQKTCSTTGLTGDPQRRLYREQLASGFRNGNLDSLTAHGSAGIPVNGGLIDLLHSDPYYQLLAANLRPIASCATELERRSWNCPIIPAAVSHDELAEKTDQSPSAVALDLSANSKELSSPLDQTNHIDDCTNDVNDKQQQNESQIAQSWSPKVTSLAPFRCPTCPLMFFEAFELYNAHCWNAHSRLVCRYCSLSFANKRNVERHMRRHTGEQPYSCTHCTRRFYRDDDLRRHRLKHDDRGTDAWHNGMEAVAAWRHTSTEYERSVGTSLASTTLDASYQQLLALSKLLNVEIRK